MVKKKKTVKMEVETEPLDTNGCVVDTTTQPLDTTTASATEPSEEETAKKFAVEPTVKLPESGTVTLKVLVGTLAFEGKSYEKNSIITVSRERAERFDPRDIEVI